MRFRWIRVPVPMQLTPSTVHEHTPLDPYRYGEYPRFIRPVRDETRWEWRKLYEDGRTARPGEELDPPPLRDGDTLRVVGPQETIGP